MSNHDAHVRPEPDELEGMERGLLHMLVADQRHWSMEELLRAMDGREVDGPVSELVAAGLAHRCGDFVFASRAAVRSEELAV
jgi:hypothetical protein